MNTIYFANVVGSILPETCIDASGAVIDLTSKTATLNIYSFGSGTLTGSHAMTPVVPAAGTVTYTAVLADFPAVGDYYTLVVITGTGYSYTMPATTYRIVPSQDTIVTSAELLAFMEIPIESAKADNVIRDFLNEAQAQLNLDVPNLKPSTDPDFIQLKQYLIKLRAGQFYYMTMDEGNVNPNVRLQKIAAWKTEYVETTNALNRALSASSTSTGAIRRVKNSCYSDPSSMYYIDPNP